MTPNDNPLVADELPSTTAGVPESSGTPFACPVCNGTGEVSDQEPMITVPHDCSSLQEIMRLFRFLADNFPGEQHGTGAFETPVDAAMRLLAPKIIRRSFTFRGWLKLQQHRTDEIGKLSRDAFADTEWRGLSYMSLHQRIIATAELGKAHAELELLDQAWREYVRHE